MILNGRAGVATASSHYRYLSSTRKEPSAQVGSHIVHHVTVPKVREGWQPSPTGWQPVLPGNNVLRVRKFAVTESFFGALPVAR
jgi:hypothetical protein